VSIKGVPHCAQCAKNPAAPVAPSASASSSSTQSATTPPPAQAAPGSSSTTTFFNLSYLMFRCLLQFLTTYSATATRAIKTIKTSVMKKTTMISSNSKKMSVFGKVSFFNIWFSLPLNPSDSLQN
jgi:hypothetical protein